MELHQWTGGSADAGLTRKSFLRQTAAAGAALGLFGIAGCGSGSGSSSAPSGGNAGGGSPRRGGTLTAGITANGVDTIDAHKPATWVSDARVAQMFDLLAFYDQDYKLQMGLAEEVSTDKPDEWTIRIRKGVTFHDGKKLTIDDVIFSLNRMIDPKTAAGSAAALASLDPKGFKKLDPYTVRLKLKRPDVTISDALTQWTSGIVPEGYDPKKPIGTGPFKLDSYQPNERSEMSRNPDYWEHGKPYVDKLIIVDFQDDTARVNALLSGQVDVIDHVPLSQIRVLKGRNDLKLIQSKDNGQFVNFCMRVDTAPFDDNDVRMAMRLAADRKEIVEKAISGYGRIGNDVPSPVDPAYNSNLPQREQDIEKAKFLLKRAGKENLSVELTTSQVSSGATEAAQVYAEQAKAAGITVNLKKVDGSVLYGPNWLKWPMAMDFWGTHSYLNQTALSHLPTSPFNETHWPEPESRKRYLGLYEQALGTLEEGKRNDLLHEMQQIEYERGGDIIWGFQDQMDACKAKVNGLAPTKASLPLDFFGFKHAWLS